MKQFKFFIGTLYCGEAGFEKCLESISSQTGVHIEHKIISNKPEKEAHDELWSAFSAASQDYDILTKIDADMILANSEILLRISELFSTNSRITSVEAPLYDYFTDGLINSINSFSSKVKFGPAKTLYCDRVTTNHDIRLLSPNLPDSLIPAGYHCLYTNEVQAFHYGLHRGIKNQKNIYDCVKIAYDRNPCKIRLFALLGFQASNCFNDQKGFDYNDIRFDQAFKKAEKIVNEINSSY